MIFMILQLLTESGPSSGIDPGCQSEWRASFTSDIKLIQTKNPNVSNTATDTREKCRGNPDFGITIAGQLKLFIWPSRPQIIFWKGKMDF
jgi:hypothetical protein